MSDASDRPPIALPDEIRLRDEYRVGTVLGAGSFGITYRCLDEHLDTAVAIKEYYPRHIAGRTEDSLHVRPHTDEDTESFEDGLQQFMEEGRTVARFDHPNVVDVKSYFEENGTGYLVMDYYEGQSLDDRLAAEGGRLPEEEVIEYILDVLEGLGPVHEAGVLHRDIDPKNVYLRADGSRSGRRAILIDFGAAREAVGQRSQSLSVILKPGYAPPEQYRPNGNHGPWTDVYACAATLYKCLTGLKPPVASARVESDELVPPSEVNGEVSLETDLAIRKGLALDTERRPSSAQAFADLLRRSQTADDTAGGTARRPDSLAEETLQGPVAHTRSVREEPNVAEEASAEDGAADKTVAEKAPSDFEGTVGARASVSVVQPEEHARGWSLATLASVITGAVGTGVAFSDAGFGQILGFFGTWILVCGGLIGLFRQGERLMRPESRAAISDWLLGEDFTEKVSGWPTTFVGLFDAVFSENHFSWICFWRSAMVSITIVTLISIALFVWKGSSSTFPDQPSDLFLLIALVWTFNTIVDYVSLYETRHLLGWMDAWNHSLFFLTLLIVDLILTALIFMGSFLFLSIFEIKVFPAPVLAPEVNPNRLGYSILWERVIPIIGSTLFTSVWVWLYVGAGLLLKALRPLLDSLDWVKRLLDVERRPAEAMGLLLVALTSVVFAISAPFVL